MASLQVPERRISPPVRRFFSERTLEPQQCHDKKQKVMPENGSYYSGRKVQYDSAAIGPGMEPNFAITPVGSY
jgi:hypothetical protein